MVGVIAIAVVSVVRFASPAPGIHPVICPESSGKNLDFSGFTGDHLVVQLREKCFGALVTPPRAWSYWYTRTAGEEAEQWHAYWFENDAAPIGPFFADSREIVGRSAHAAFRMEGRGVVAFYNKPLERPGPEGAEPTGEEIARAMNQTGARRPAGISGTGATLYATFCADCHGKNAEPPGAIASGRNLRAPDLRLLARRNEGVFPLRAVEKLLSGTSQAPIIHGGIDMPVWAPVLSHQMGDHDISAAEAAHSLARYIESQQR